MGSEREKEKNNTKIMPNNRSYLDTFTNGEIKSVSYGMCEKQ
tara:strand:+ start:424 stop:549 length:126 start_codon:yes stop_codon:yes gene_type:complete